MFIGLHEKILFRASSLLYGDYFIDYIGSGFARDSRLPATYTDRDLTAWLE
jgi:hypothetical protein